MAVRRMGHLSYNDAILTVWIRLCLVALYHRSAQYVTFEIPLGSFMSELASRDRWFAAHIKALPSITKLGSKKKTKTDEKTDKLQVKKTKTDRVRVSSFVSAGTVLANSIE